MYRRHSIKAALIEFDLFEFYIYPIIHFDMPFANVAWVTDNKIDLAIELRQNVF